MHGEPVNPYCYFHRRFQLSVKAGYISACLAVAIDLCAAGEQPDFHRQWRESRGSQPTSTWSTIRRSPPFPPCHISRTVSAAVKGICGRVFLDSSSWQGIWHLRNVLREVPVACTCYLTKRLHVASTKHHRRAPYCSLRRSNAAEMNPFLQYNCRWIVGFNAGHVL